jgi:hypothetical protein
MNGGQDPLTVVVRSLPQQGTLYWASANGTRGPRIDHPFSTVLTRMVSTVDQYATDVVAVSSYFMGGGAQYHPGQALGPPDAVRYGDSPLTWCVRSPTLE